MKTLQTKLLASLVIAGLLVVATLFALSFRGEKVLAGVNLFNDYISTTTPQALDLTVLCTGPGAVGDINVEAYITGNLLLLDATTSDVTLRGSISRSGSMPTATSSLIVAWIPNGMGTSTRPINSSFRNGLLLDTSGTVATTTFSYRCYQ